MIQLEHFLKICRLKFCRLLFGKERVKYSSVLAIAFTSLIRMQIKLSCQLFISLSVVFLLNI